MDVELTLKKLLMLILTMNLNFPSVFGSHLPKGSPSSWIHLAPGSCLAWMICLPPGVFLTVSPMPLQNTPPSVEGVAAAPVNEGVAAKDGFPPTNPEAGLGVAAGLPPIPHVEKIERTGMESAPLWPHPPSQHSQQMPRSRSGL